jgi:hypothetical protein
LCFRNDDSSSTSSLLRFPVLDVTGLVLAFEVGESGCPGDAHQPEHSTTCYIATSTVLENKMP